MFASCILRCSTISSILPISCHFRNCKALLVLSLLMVAALYQVYVLYLYLFTFMYELGNGYIINAVKITVSVKTDGHTR